MFDKKLKLKLEPVPFEDANEEYSLEGITHDELSDLFPEDPEHFLVHKGNVVVDGPMKVGYEWGKDDLTVYVIDGDLTINGPLVFQQADAYAALYVTGNLTCDNAYIAWTAQLFVKGSMTVKHLLATYIEDAGHFSINGSLSAGSWLECGDRGCFEIGKKPKARLLRVGEHRYYVFGPYAPKDGGDEHDAPAEDGGGEDEVDPDQKFGFSPKEAVSIKGIIHPALFEGEEDVSTDKIGEAMLKGQPLFADGSGGMTAAASKKSAPAKKAAPAKTAAPKKAAKKPATKKAAKKKPPKKKPAAKKAKPKKKSKKR